MPPPPRKSNKGLWWVIGGCSAAVAFFVAAFILLTFIRPGTTAGSNGGGGAGSAASDVTLVGCSTTAVGNLSAKLRVTNSTSRERSYYITVAFSQGGTRIADADAYVRDVAPGQTAEDEAIALARDKPSGVRCVISKVSRI